MSPNQINHITQCVLCGNRPKPFRIVADPFDPIASVGPVSKAAEDFGKKLVAHLILEGQKEQAGLQNGAAPPIGNIGDSGVFMATRTAHLHAARMLNQMAEWASRFAVLAAYHTTDPELLRFRDSTRYALNRSTTDAAAGPSDHDLDLITEALLQNLAEAESQAQKIQRLTMVLRELRDHIMYPPPPEGTALMESLISPSLIQPAR